MEKITIKRIKAEIKKIKEELDRTSDHLCKKDVQDFNAESIEIFILCELAKIKNSISNFKDRV